MCSRCWPAATTFVAHNNCTYRSASNGPIPSVSPASTESCAASLKNESPKLSAPRTERPSTDSAAAPRTATTCYAAFAATPSRLRRSHSKSTPAGLVGYTTTPTSPTTSISTASALVAELMRTISAAATRCERGPARNRPGTFLRTSRSVSQPVVLCARLASAVSATCYLKTP
jgi:hypothetical protein